jgi:hypothetical protein
MTTLIVKIESAQSLAQIDFLMYKNLRLFNRYPILDYVARMTRKRLNDRKINRA